MNIFPRTFSTVAMIVGAIWVIQGLGVADTGSFMDNQPVWAIAGGAMFLVGAISFLVRRRKPADEESSQSGS